MAPDGNPADTEYAIYNKTNDTFVAADGTTSSNPVWQIAAGWAGLTIVGLQPNTEYDFQAQVRNANEVETLNGPSSAVWTARPTVPPAVLAVSYSQASNQVVLTFSEPVAIAMKDVTVDDANQIPVDLSGANLIDVLNSSEVSLAFGASLADGRYTLTLNGNSVQDLFGNLLDGDNNGQPGSNYTFYFTVTPPTVMGVFSTQPTGAYGVGTVIPITVTFSEPVNVSGTPQLTLNDSAVANYIGGTGTATLTFTYTVATAQNTVDLDYASTTALARSTVAASRT